MVPFNVDWNDGDKRSVSSFTCESRVRPLVRITQTAIFHEFQMKVVNHRNLFASVRYWGVNISDSEESTPVDQIGRRRCDEHNSDPHLFGEGSL